MRNLKYKNHELPKHNYKPQPLPFRPPLNGISDRSIKNHHDKLYAGYVVKKNEIENRLEELGRAIVAGKTDAGNTTDCELRSLKDSETYVVNGVYLHECILHGLWRGSQDVSEGLLEKLQLDSSKRLIQTRIRHTALAS